MTAPVPYLLLPGTARVALESWREIFGGDVTLHTYADLGRADGPGRAIGHGQLDGPVSLFAADAGPDDDPLASRGLMLALLGVAEPATLRRWFDALADGGEVLDPLVERPWGDTDGQVRDRFGVRWLVGWEHS